MSGKDLEAEIATHEQNLQALDLPVADSANSDMFPTVDFPDFDIDGSKAQEGLKASIETTVSSAGSMQTPPPTSTSTSRRKTQKSQMARQSKESDPQIPKGPSTLALEETNPHSLQLSLPEDSPSHFANLNFSPEAFSFPMSGPATAPVYPQQKLFWDSEQNPGGMNLDMSLDDTFTAFGIQNSKPLDPFVSEHEQGDMAPFSTALPFTSAESRTGTISASHASALNQTNISSSTAIINHGSSNAKHRGTIFNPSLIFSSPSSRQSQDSHPMPSSSQPHQDHMMEPYAHQIRDAQIEKEIRSRKQKRKRPAEHGDSPAVRAAIEALRDDRTESSKSSPILADSFVGALPEPSDKHDFPSRKKLTPDSHYRKAAQQNSLHRRKSDKTSRKHPAVTLEIDENGRAVTKTSFVRDPSMSRMDVDSESEQSDNSAASSEFHLVPSRQNSFKLANPQSKLVRKARFAHDPHSHSQRSSDTSTLASSNSARSAPKIGGNLKLVVNAGHAQPCFHSALPDNDIPSEAETVVESSDDKGDATSEIKKIVRQSSLRKSGSRSSLKQSLTNTRRQSYAPQTTSKTGPYYNATSSLGPSSGRRLSYHEQPHQLHSNISPTTITDPDLTPSSGRASNISNDSTRCVCGLAEENGQLMIQW